MKTILLITLIGLLIFLRTYAQQKIVISEDSLKIGNSLLPCFSVTIPEANYEDVLKAWTRELESGTRSKVHTDNGEMQILGGKIKDISKEAINVYSKIERLDSLLVLYATFETRKDQYLTSQEADSKYLKARDFMKDFAKERYIDVVKSQTDMEAQKLRDLKRELSSLEKEKSRIEKSIETSKSSIISNKENIVLMENEVQNIEKLLVGQDSLIVSAEEGPLLKEKEKQINELEKRKRKAIKSTDSSQKKIAKSNEKIEKATRDIPQNERMQEMVRVQIDQQQEVYQFFLDKLNKIRSY